MDLCVGDIAGNSSRIVEAMARAEDEEAQILALPELAITGYPPEDLLLKSSFIAANRSALEQIAEASGEVLVVVGFVDREDELLYNAAGICARGQLLGLYRKQLLPNYGVFDERRYFSPGVEHLLLDTSEGVVGICICEDAWSPAGPLVSQGDAGAQLVVNINASPFHKNKQEAREQMLCDRARRAGASIAYVNMVGGQDELVFDGGSVVIDPKGEVVWRGPQFTEHFAVIDVPMGEVHGAPSPATKRIEVALVPATPGAPAPSRENSGSNERLSGAPEVYAALSMSLKDYVRKNGFAQVVIGLSGGIDSALTAALAADALGPENVLGVTMPSPFSSGGSVDDSAELARNLGFEMITIPIADLYDSYTGGLEKIFGATEMGLAEENLQARIRGTLLMAISNRYGHLVLATGNKSEMACGYATLYGDMAGGFALLKDVFKTEVYELCQHRNRDGAIIPIAIIEKPPSAELRPDQKDSDSLPPYEVLDAILEAYIEEDAGIAEIVAAGHDPEVVRKVVGLVDRAEYKRRQAAPGPKVTTKAFGRDRRLPITNCWKEVPDEALPGRSVGAEGGE
ncbi:MAG: NAD+ synthase [Actinobacteria bacterium]|nr:NAD+ synthase [Actinomycetota bacterium]